MSAHLLLVEDDKDLRNMIQEALGESGYKITEAGTVAKAIAAFDEKPVDLVILDLTLPDGNGLQVAERIRAHRKRFHTPIIVLTADDKMESKVEGFSAGADQYLVKPFNVSELALWVSALLRRIGFNEENSGVLHAEDFEIDPSTHVVKTGGREITNLTRKEFDLLYHLVSVRPKILSKSYIMDKMWHTVLTDNTVEVHIRHIRTKLGKDAAARIVTVSGKGYKFV